MQVTLGNPRKKEDPRKRKEGRRYEEPDEKERERKKITTAEVK